MYINKLFFIALISFACFDLSVAVAQRRVPIQQQQPDTTNYQDALKSKLAKPGSPGQNKVDVEPTVIPQVERQVVKNDYSGYQKSSTSNVFGSEFFDTPSLSFEPNLRVATPSNYILGPDDELIINVSGYQETNIKTSVQAEGTIFIPQVGSISVNGLTIEEATSRIRDKMAQTAYSSLRSGLSRLIISLGKIRSIHVTIIGAARPGNYVTSSLATVFNSLYICGGPGNINTYRNIELIRNNKVYQTIDIYQFLTRGDQKGNIQLKDNDVINFPVYKKHVTISGQVKKNSVFELKDGENFNDLLFFAGGYTDKAYKASIKVKQNTDTERKIRDISKQEISTYVPSNGDEIQVAEILDKVENSVSIGGAVYRPGEFELTPGLTISALIKRAGGLMENGFTDRATITRTRPDGTRVNFSFNVIDAMKGGSTDLPLVKYDVVTIAPISTFKTDYKVKIGGEVRKPGEYPFSENMSLKDLFFIAGGFTDAASTYHVEVGRRLITDGSNKVSDSVATVFNINTDTALRIENDKFILKPFDVITVRKNPGFIVQQSATVNGEVYYPGTYTIQSKKDRISDLIKRAGGLTAFAYSNGIFLIRNNPKNSAQEQSAKDIQNSIKDTSAKVIQDISRPNFRIAVNIAQVLDNPGSIQDYVLQDNDELEVLRVDPLVKLSGEVLSATKTGFIGGKNIQYYLSQAGGTTDNARRSKIYVLYPNGHIGRTKNGFLGIFRSYPKIEAGSEIIVPRKIESKGLDAQQTVGLTSAIVSLVSLIIVTISVLKR